jgi:hypothetical protein
MISGLIHCSGDAYASWLERRLSVWVGSSVRRRVLGEVLLEAIEALRSAASGGREGIDDAGYRRLQLEAAEGAWKLMKALERIEVLENGSRGGSGGAGAGAGRADPAMRRYAEEGWASGVTGERLARVCEALLVPAGGMVAGEGGEVPGRGVEAGGWEGEEARGSAGGAGDAQVLGRGSLAGVHRAHPGMPRPIQVLGWMRSERASEPGAAD